MGLWLQALNALNALQGLSVQALCALDVSQGLWDEASRVLIVFQDLSVPAFYALIASLGLFALELKVSDSHSLTLEKKNACAMTSEKP